MGNMTLPAGLLLFYGVRLPNHPGKWLVHDRLRQALGVQVGREMECVRKGLKWLLDPSDYVEADLFWLGAKDTWETWHVLQRVPRGGVILDIGSNFGYYSLVLASELKRDCAVHAFEPNPRTFERLRRNIERNGLGDVVRAHAVALSDAPGTAFMETPDGNSGAASLSTGSGGAAVRVESLDDFAAAQDLRRLDFVKIDVEGYESRVLSGGRHTLAKHAPHLLVEINPPALAAQGVAPQAVLDQLRDLGYEPFEIHRRRLLPLSTAPSGEDYTNVFCIHRSKR